MEDNLMDNLSSIFDMHHLVSTAIVLVAMLIALAVSNFLFKKSFKRHMAAGRTRYGTITRVTGSVTKILIVFIAILWIMSIYGYNVRSFLAGLGLVSAVIGLALQDTLKDYLMGIHIIMDESMDISSLVTINGHTGIVESFTLRTTKLFDINLCGTIYICNRDIVSIEEGFPFFDISIPISQDNSEEAVTSCLGEAAGGLTGIKGVEKAEYLGVSEFTNNGMRHLIRVWPDLRDLPNIRRDCNSYISKAIDRRDILLTQERADSSRIS